MTFYIDPPNAGAVQGIGGYRPGADDWPSYVCDHAKEDMHITDLASARRFFLQKCRWGRRHVRGITAVVFLEGQTWRTHGTIVWPSARRGTHERDGDGGQA
jgi:hypothetical protein